MSNLQAAASGLWRAEKTASAAAPGKWIPSCAYNGFRVSRSNNRAKTLFMHTRVFSDLSLNYRHQCRGFRCKSSGSVLAMTISSSSSEKSCEEEEFSSSSGSSHQRGAESKETEVVLAEDYEANDLITTTTTASSLFQRHATAKTSSCIEDGKRNAAGFEKTDLFGQGIAKLQLLGVAVVLSFGMGASAASASILGLKLSSKGKPLPCFASVSSVVSEDILKEKERGGASLNSVRISEVPSVEGLEKDRGDKEPQAAEEEGGGKRGGDQGSPALQQETMENEDGNRSATREETQAEELNGKEEFTDEDDEDDDLDDEEDDDGGDDQFPHLKELEDLDEDRELRIAAAAAASELSGNGDIQIDEGGEDRPVTEEELMYEEWKSQPYALTVPLRIVGLRGSVPPIWLKEFLMSQGKNAKLAVEFKGSLSDILADMAASMEKRNLTPRSAMAADLVTVGDSWLATAVQGGLIEPITNAEQFEWFQRLDSKWKRLLRRDVEGMIDPQGPIWGVPYRWGSFLIAYRRDKLKRNGIPPIKDWKDLFRPELAGKVAMVDSPREVVGAVLKSLGASYNTKDFDKEVPGGREAVKERFHALQKQVRLFDDVEYMKAMSAGDVWVAVGWSSDVFPFAKRALNVTVIAPESGTSLWADLWSIPATTSIKSEKVGGRVRGPSPLAFQWLDFCLQPARAETFKKKDVFVGASPLYLSQGTEVKLEANNNHGGNIETNIVDGMPPVDIVAKSEFLEPLSEKAIEDYHWLLSHPVEVQGWPNGLVGLMKQFFQSCSQWARTRAIRS
ncbi:unnamed protein product [Sphagnum balticum]